MSDYNAATENVETQNLELAHSHLELHVYLNGVREFRFPFFEDLIGFEPLLQAGSSEWEHWRASLQGESVTLKSAEGPEHALRPGESVLVGDSRVWLVDTRKPPLATIEGVNDELVGRVWHIKNQQYWLGRQGKRLNHIELNHSTVSRVHATFLPGPNGRISLLAESKASPTTVDGSVVEAGEAVALSSGALLGFGKLLFRFHSQVSGATEQSRVFVSSLGGFQLSLSSETGSRVEIKNQKARWLFAMLAAAWGKPVSAEKIMEVFWPEVSSSRGRKNLSHCISQLKDSFKQAGASLDSFLDRSPSELRLKAESLGGHDYIEVLKLVSAEGPITSSSVLERLLKHYQPPYLPGCYEDWAQHKRSSLDAKVTKTLMATAKQGLSSQEYRLAETAAQALLKVDEFHEEAVGLLMELALAEAKPEEVVSLYEKLERSLKTEGLEPSINLVRLYHRAKMGL